MKEELKETSATIEKDISRRRFLSFAGLAGAGLVIASCNKNDDDDDPKPTTPDGSVDLGTEDFGLLNYMYALKQLSAAFYTRVTTSFYTDAPTAETEIIPEIRAHEIAHRELLRNMLGDKRIQDFEFFLDDKVDFTSRWAVLTTAAELEEKMLSAFLGIAGRFASADYLMQVSKMASVDGRHDAYVRDLAVYNSFATNVNASHADTGMTPEDVLGALSKYYPTFISAKRLPKF